MTHTIHIHTHTCMFFFSLASTFTHCVNTCFAIFYDYFWKIFETMKSLLPYYMFPRFFILLSLSNLRDFRLRTFLSSRQTLSSWISSHRTYLTPKTTGIRKEYVYALYCREIAFSSRFLRNSQNVRSEHDSSCRPSSFIY